MVVVASHFSQRTICWSFKNQIMSQWCGGDPYLEGYSSTLCSLSHTKNLQPALHNINHSATCLEGTNDNCAQSYSNRGPHPSTHTNTHTHTWLGLPVCTVHVGKFPTGATILLLAASVKNTNSKWETQADMTVCLVGLRFNQHTHVALTNCDFNVDRGALYVNSRFFQNTQTQATGQIHVEVMTSRHSYIIWCWQYVFLKPLVTPFTADQCLSVQNCPQWFVLCLLFAALCWFLKCLVWLWICCMYLFAHVCALCPTSLITGHRPMSQQFFFLLISHLLSFMLQNHQSDCVCVCSFLGLWSIQSTFFKHVYLRWWEFATLPLPITTLLSNQTHSIPFSEAHTDKNGLWRLNVPCQAKWR